MSCYSRLVNRVQKFCTSLSIWPIGEQSTNKRERERETKFVPYMYVARHDARYLQESPGRLALENSILKRSYQTTVHRALGLLCPGFLWGAVVRARGVQ